MKERVDALVGAHHGGAQVSTFHSWCLRLLRRHAGRVGYRDGFVVYDDADQTALLKDCLAELQIDDRSFPPRLFRRLISDAKNRGLDAAGLEALKEGFQDEQAAKASAPSKDGRKACTALTSTALTGKALALSDGLPVLPPEWAPGVAT